jgi:predicted lipoprotein with Yx(FWY)xxD motif
LAFVVPAFAQEELPYTVNLSPDGPYFVGPNGMTLYTFDVDTLDVSNCYDRCATAWPPLYVDSADALTIDPAVTGEFGTSERTDGSLIVTYEGQPLYYWFRDEAPGDTTGQAVGNVWWLAQPATVYIQRDAELGPYLVGPNGMTVYMFTNDTQGSGESACSGDCLTNWPAVTVASEDELLAGSNITGLGTITRDDGALQVTYHGWPLYFFAEDMARGDTTGEGRGERWWTIAPDTVVVSSNDELGDFLVNGMGGKTLYTFTHDTDGTSTCSGECATAWPPFTVAENVRLVAGEGAEGELGTVAREDGSLQVTYNGMPLYTYAEDMAAGDTNGQGVGDVWFVAAS